MYAIIKNNRIIGGAADIEIAEWCTSNNDGSSYVQAPDDFTVYGFKIVDGVITAKTTDDLEHEAAISEVLSNRRMSYPPITDYLDGIVKGDQAQIQAYIDACNAIKEKYPKPNEVN